MSDEREDLLALLTTPGWLRLVQHAKAQWGVKAYAVRLENCKDMTELSANKMAFAWLNEVLNWPAERSETLTKNLPDKSEPVSMSRRGGL